MGSNNHDNLVKIPLKYTVSQ